MCVILAGCRPASLPKRIFIDSKTCSYSPCRIQKVGKQNGFEISFPPFLCNLLKLYRLLGNTGYVDEKALLKDSTDLRKMSGGSKKGVIKDT